MAKKKTKPPAVQAIPTVPRCITCEVEPGVSLDPTFADKDSETGYVGYANATKRPLFCSETCAAAHALLWFDWEGHKDTLARNGQETKSDN